MGKIFAKLASLHFTSFKSRSDEFRTDVIQSFIKDEVLKEFETGRFSPKIFKELNLDEVKLGHEIMEKNQNSGKIVLKIH